MAILDCNSKAEGTSSQVKVKLSLDGLDADALRNVRIHALATNYLSPETYDTFDERI